MNNNIIIDLLKKLNFLELKELIIEIEKTFSIDLNNKYNNNSINNKIEIKKELDKNSDIVEEKKSYDIILEYIPTDKKVQILKIIRSATGLSLKECKDIIDNIPKLIKKCSSKDEYNNIKKVSDSDLNSYIQEHMGEQFTIKDFRTYAANYHFVESLISETNKRTPKNEKVINT